MSTDQSNLHLSSAEIPDNSEALEFETKAIAPKILINWWLTLLYSSVTVTGSIGYPLLQRLYFTHGGSSKWLSSFIQFAGFILLIFPLSFLFYKTLSHRKPAIFMDPKLALSSASLGLLMGFDGFLFAAGYSSLPVSTASLVSSSQLVFTAMFAFIIVRHKITFYSLNSVVVVTCGIVVLALSTGGDQPAGESRNKYLTGFFSMLAAAALCGLVYPLVELAYSKSSRPLSFFMLLQFQFVNGLLSTLFTIAGMLISQDYKMIGKEAAEFSLGKTKYWMILIAIVVCMELTSIAMMGLVSCTSCLFNGILCAATLPMNEVAGVITFGDKFNGRKGLSLSLCLWGFASYFIGEYKKTSRTKPIAELNCGNGALDGIRDIRSEGN